MKIQQIELDRQVGALARALKQMRAEEKIPASQQHAAIRARLLEAFSDESLSVFKTRLGWMGVTWNSRGIVALNLPRLTRGQAWREIQRDHPSAVALDQVPIQIERELREYVAGRRHRFDLPLDWSSLKPFQRAVLEAASHIPFGETRSYGWIAQQIGKPGASRAVGQALGANPIPIILPCHRVIASNGGLGGYGGGLPLKKKLLRLEGAMA